MYYHARIRKWGNSLGIRIQKSVAEEAHIKENSTVRVSVSDESIVITPVTKNAYLKELVDKITPENMHPEFDFGERVGKEEW
jgi:antitoxin MazE